MAAVSLSSLTKVFPNGQRALDDLTLAIADGEFFALLGPSGCGKTTLLRVIAGLEAPSTGQVSIGGRVVTRLPPGVRNVAMVFQDYALYPHMDVADNIAYPLRIKKISKGARRVAAAETGGQLGLGDLMERRPSQLSGGQQQRAALARAMVSRPEVFLLDEPLSNLDARLRMEARTFLKRLHAEVKTTTVYVTHDQSEALALADRMAVMDRGVIRQLGTPTEIFQRPANLFVAQFIGSTPMNILRGVCRGDRFVVGTSSLPVPPMAAGLVADGEDVRIGIRPEYMDLSFEASGDALPATVAIIEPLGTAYLVTLESDGTTIQVVVPEDRPPRVADQLWAVADWRRALVYRARTGDLVCTTAAGDAPSEERPADPVHLLQ